METVLITGASSGIGEALAHKFAANGYNLVLVARTKSKLKTLAKSLKSATGVRAVVEVADLAAPGAPEELAARLSNKSINIDILVNNAGCLEQGYFASMEPANHLDLIDLNIKGFTGMLSEFLPPMLERRSGRILNVASIAAFQPVPGLATYAATKAFVLSLSESLLEETRGTGVTVTALCPGVTKTNMVSTAQENNESLAKLPDFVLSEVDDVAQQAYKACMSGQAIVVPGSINQAAAITGRAMPKFLVRRFAGLMGRRSADKVGNN